MEEMLPFLGIISISFPIKQFPHHVEHHQSNGNTQKNASLQIFAVKKAPTKQKNLSNFWTKGYFWSFCCCCCYCGFLCAVINSVITRYHIKSFRKVWTLYIFWCCLISLMDLKSYLIKTLLAEGKFLVNSIIERKPLISLAFPRLLGMISYSPQLLAACVQQPGWASEGRERRDESTVGPMPGCIGVWVGCWGKGWGSAAHQVTNPTPRVWVSYTFRGLL